MRILKTGLVIFLLLGMALVIVHSYFLDQSAAFLLRQSGAEAVRLQGLRIGLHSVAVADFAASIVLPGGDRLSLETKNTVIRYSIQQLLQRAKGQRADIAELRLTLKRETAASSVPFQFPDTIVLLKEELRSRLPLSTLRIQKIRFLGDFPGALVGKDMLLDAAVRSGELQIALLAQLGPGVVAELAMQSPDSNNATARISLKAKGGQTLQGELQLTPDKVWGKMDCSLQELRELLAAAEISPILPGMDAKVSLQVELPLGVVSERALLLTVVATDLESAQLASTSLRVHLVVVPVNGGVDLGGESRIELMQLQLTGLDVHKISLGLGGSFRYPQGQFAVRFLEGQKLVAEGIKVSGAELDDLELEFEETLYLQIDDGLWSVADNAILTTPLTIARKGRILESGVLRCAFSGLNEKFAASGLMVAFSSPRLAYTDSEQSLAVQDLSGVVQLVEQRLTGKLQFVPEIFGGQIQLQFHHGLASQAGGFRLDTPTALEFNEPGAMLSSLKKRWSYPFDLENGKLIMKMQGDYGPEIEPLLRVQIDLSEGSGFAKQFLFNGLSLAQKLSIDPDLRVRGGGNIALDHLMGGLDTYDIRADLVVESSGAGDLPLVELDNFRASLLGGSLTSSAIRYDLNSPQSNFVVNIQGMSLVSLMDLVKINNLMVTGDIGGTLPVRIESREVSVVDAEFHSEGAGGEIRYTPGMMNQSGVTGYALKAIENLQYEKLKVIADYAPSGVLDMLIAIRGTSPGLDTTRPVQLNINAEQNLPALLKSLRFSKGLTDELDKRVKRHYN